jgi:hypothetical protein
MGFLWVFEDKTCGVRVFRNLKHFRTSWIFKTNAHH